MIGNHAGDLYKVKLLIVLMTHDIIFHSFVSQRLFEKFIHSGHEIGTEKNEGDTDQTTLFRSV